MNNNIVRGIVYKPQQQKQEPRDIYGETIDLSGLFSYQHDPVKVDTPVEQTYEQKYSFIRPKQEEIGQSEPTVEQRSTSTLIVPTYGEVVSNQQKTYSSNEDAWTDAWNKFGKSLGIKDQKAYAYLLGQIKHESGDFKYMEGLNTGEEYEGRKDLGNNQTGDGRRFKERGPIQVTGRANYEKIYKDFFVPNGLGEYDIVNNPELAKDPYVGSLLSIGWLATTSNGKRAIDAANRYDVKGATYAINGGYNGLNDRIKRTNELLANLS